MKKENKVKKMEEKQRLVVDMKVAHDTVIVINFLANDIFFLIFFNATIFFWIWSFRSSHKRRSFKTICKHLILRY